MYFMHKCTHTHTRTSCIDAHTRPQEKGSHDVSSTPQLHVVSLSPSPHDIAVEGVEDALVGQLQRVIEHLLVLEAARKGERLEY